MTRWIARHTSCDFPVPASTNNVLLHMARHMFILTYLFYFNHRPHLHLHIKARTHNYTRARTHTHIPTDGHRVQNWQLSLILSSSTCRTTLPHYAQHCRLEMGSSRFKFIPIFDWQGVAEWLMLFDGMQGARVRISVGLTVMGSNGICREAIFT